MNVDRTLRFFRLELAEVRRARWVAFTGVVYGLAFAAFVALGLTESSVLGFTGLSRVVMNVANGILVAVPLLALIATTQTLVRARTTGLFELLLTQPSRRSEWFAGVVMSRAVVLLAPLALLLVGALVVGGVRGDDAALVPTVTRTIAIAAALVWAFVGIGMFVSSCARSGERAIVYALVVWLWTIALHDFALIGALLRWELPPRLVFFLAASNPVESARLGVLASVDPDLSVLGPVGFWIANMLGPRMTTLVAVAWPALLGTTLLVLAKRRLDRADLV